MGALNLGAPPNTSLHPCCALTGHLLLPMGGTSQNKAQMGQSYESSVELEPCCGTGVRLTPDTYHLSIPQYNSHSTPEEKKLLAHITAQARRGPEPSQNDCRFLHRMKDNAKRWRSRSRAAYGGMIEGASTGRGNWVCSTLGQITTGTETEYLSKRPKNVAQRRIRLTLMGTA